EVMSAIGVDGDPGVSTPLHLSRAANGCAGHGSARESRSRDARSRGDPRANGCAPHGPPHLPAFLMPLVEDLESCDAIELDARLRRALRIEQRWLAEMSPPLRQVSR